MEEAIRILVVDDEPDIRRICRILLYKENHRQCRWFQKALAMHRKNVLL